jgi:hypothetical protein
MFLQSQRLPDGEVSEATFERLSVLRYCSFRGYPDSLQRTDVCNLSLGALGTTVAAYLDRSPVFRQFST